MSIAVIEHRAGLSDYIVEMLRTWGIMGVDTVDSPDMARHEVVIVPAGAAVDEEQLVAYVRQGGCVIAMMPRGAVAEAAGIAVLGDKPLPACLRMTTFAPSGWTGELYPIVGRAQAIERDDRAEVLGYLCYIDSFENETPAVTETAVGKGFIVSLAYDLPRCVMLMRQGDSALAEQIPEGDACARPTHFASKYFPGEAGWMPHADLQSRMLVDLIVAHRAGPTALLDHLPGGVESIMLYSGDEDVAAVSASDEELAFLHSHGARMDLYIIPTATQSTAEDVRRFAMHHDVGPHPDIRKLDRKPIAERCAEMKRQIEMFEKTYGIKARTMRNHCTAWAGYMELIETLEQCGVRMETNYTSGSYKRFRNHAPYAPFGAAMPMRFCRDSGEMIDVFQQHTHIMDDVWFAPDRGERRKTKYSYRFDPKPFGRILGRILRDARERFNTPVTTCIHPGNWVTFSRAHGQTLVLQAVEQRLPVWSFTQWSKFWDARDTWRQEKASWNGSELTVTLAGREADERLHVQLAAESGQRKLQSVAVDGRAVETVTSTRHGRPVALVPLGSRLNVTITARYN